MGQFKRPLTKLTMTWTRRVERIDGEMLPVWDAISDEGEKFIVHIKKIQNIEDENDEKDK